MNTTTTVYGMTVELPDPPAGMIVADVVILARAVPVDGDRGRDALLAGVTADTGGMVYRGILAAAADARPARAARTLTFDAAPLLDSVNTVGDYQRILAQQRAQHLARRTAR